MGVGREGRQNALQWRHNDHDGVSNHQPHCCLLNRLFRRKSKKTSKPRATSLCAGNSPGSVNSPHKGPVTRKMFSFDDVIMCRRSHDWMISLNVWDDHTPWPSMKMSNRFICGSGKMIELPEQLKSHLHALFHKHDSMFFWITCALTIASATDEFSCVWCIFALGAENRN